MKNLKMKLKKVAAATLAAAMCLSCLSGCGSDKGADTSQTSGSETVSETAEAAPESESQAEAEENTNLGSYKICVYTLKATGSIVDAVDAFMGSISNELNITYEVRFAGDDAATLLDNVQTAIAEGFNGIISMTDKGNNAAILELCEESGVYFGGTWSNQGSSLNSSDAGYDILKSAYYVGSIADGRDDYEGEVLSYAKAIADEYNALGEDEKEGAIGITTNPSKWTPGHQIAAQNMYETLTTEYGIPDSAFATETISPRSEDETYAGTTLEAGTWQFPQVDVSSMSLPAAYFQSNSNLKLICSFASITYIEPALQNANLHGKVKIWTCGYESEDYLMNNFGTQGDQTYQGFRTAPIEDVAFPLVIMLDKLNGNSYADREAKISELVEAMDSEMSAKFQLKSYLIPYSSSIIITGDEAFEKFVNNYVYGNGDGQCSIVSADDLKNLMVTCNPDASYEELVAFFDESGRLDASIIK